MAFPLPTPTSLASTMIHLRHLESSITRVLMEATLKLSSLTDAGCFVLFETADGGRRFGGSSGLLAEFMDGKLTAEGAHLITLKDSSVDERAVSSAPGRREDIGLSFAPSNERDVARAASEPWKISSASVLPDVPFLNSTTPISSISRKRPAIDDRSSSSPKSTKLTHDRNAPLTLIDDNPLVKEEDIVALDFHRPTASRDTSRSSFLHPASLANKPSMHSSLTIPTPLSVTNSLADDDWDDDIEEIICDLDVTPLKPDLKPSLSDNGMVVSVTSSPYEEVGNQTGNASLLRDVSGSPLNLMPSIQPETLRLPLATSVASLSSVPRVRMDAMMAQHRTIVEALEANQTELSLQKLDVLGQQDVDEMFTKGTTAYALLKSCLYTQGKILSQLCPFKDRDIKDVDVKAFFNDNFEAILLLCPANLRDCYFSENPYWLVDLLESASKRNSKVSLIAFVKDQARNGFKAEFKKKRGDGNAQFMGVIGSPLF